jgi:hypothetical protein
MAAPSNPLSLRRLPEPVRRRLEVATAMAWEALVEAHTAHALHFIALLGDRLAFDEAVDRYLNEVDAADAVATSVRTRVLSALEDAQQGGHARPRLELAGEADPGADEGLRRFRPDVVMRGLIERHRRQDETAGWVRLAIARAEEGLVDTHVDNAITFVALLDGHLPADRAVEEYIGAIGLAGARAQSVSQRTLARIAEARLPLPGKDS